MYNSVENEKTEAGFPLFTIITVFKQKICFKSNTFKRSPVIISSEHNFPEFKPNMKWLFLWTEEGQSQVGMQRWG